MYYGSPEYHRVVGYKGGRIIYNPDPETNCAMYVINVNHKTKCGWLVDVNGKRVKPIISKEVTGEDICHKRWYRVGSGIHVEHLVEEAEYYLRWCMAP